jgi:Holliday junction resolvasome RuvABC endonuclease subunit
MDPWLRYTGWNIVLEQSKHSIIKTHEFVQEPDKDEPELQRLLQAWQRILERCLDSLANIDYKERGGESVPI